MIPQENRETFEVILSNRVLLYKLFHKTFGREPDDAFLALLRDPAVGEAFSLLSAEEGDIMSRAAAFIGAQPGDADHLAQLRNEYMRLFVGPQQLIAPPWESVYRSHQGLLFQESTLTIREIYRSHGYLPQGYPRVPDDSLALELDFMSRMAEKALAALSSGQDEQLAPLLTAQESFVRVHLLFFVPKLLERMAASSFQLFYPRMTKALHAFLELDLELLKDMLSACA